MSSCWLQRIRDDTGAIQDDRLNRDLKGDSLKGDSLKEVSLTLPLKALIYPQLLKALIGGDMEEPASQGYNVYQLHDFIVNIHVTVTR